MSPRTRSSALVIGVAMLAAMTTTLGTRIAYDSLHRPDTHFTFVNTDPRAKVCKDLVVSPNIEYLEYKGDGAVWVRWPDGRFVQVVPK